MASFTLTGTFKIDVVIGPPDTPPPSGPTLGALSFGTPILTSTMGPGAVVAAISGKTAGSAVSMTGTAFSSGKLAVNAAGTAIIVGAAGPLTASDTTGTFSLTETLAGATNSPRTSGPFASITVADGSVGLAYVKLVYPSTEYFLDTVATGGTLAELRDFQTGAAYGVTVIAQGADVVPPANALVVENGLIKAGAGWAALNHGFYKLRITHLLTGFVSESQFIKVSDAATTYTAANATQLASVLTTIGGLIDANPAGFPGAAIDLTPGVDYGHFDLTQLPNRSAHTKPVVLRSASPDRMGPNKPIFRSLHWTGCRYLRIQSIALRGETDANLRRTFLSGGSSRSDFVQIYGVDLLGGRPVWQPDGTVTLDTAQAFDPADPWHPAFTCIDWSLTSGSVTNLRVRAGHRIHAGDPSMPSGPAVGVGGAWTDLPTPAFIGSNLTGGDSAPLVLPLEIRSGQGGGGTGFAAEIRTQFLTASSTPPKPAAQDGYPAPDGRYITGIRLISGGSGYSSSLNTGVVQWNGYRTAGTGLWTACTVGQNEETRNFVMANSVIRSVSRGIVQHFRSVADSKWLVNNKIDCCFEDQTTHTWGPNAAGGSADPAIIYRWDQDNSLTLAWMFHGRTNVHPSLFGNPHGDGQQGWDSTNSLGRAEEQPFVDVYGCTMWPQGGLGTYQGGFWSDLTGSSLLALILRCAGYQLRSTGNLYGVGLVNGLVMHATYEEWSAYDLVFTALGSGTRQDDIFGHPGFVPISVRDKCIASANTEKTGIPADQRYRDVIISSRNSTTNFADPLLTWTDDVAELRRRFTPIGPAVGYGPFADRELIIDHVNRVWNPNAQAFRMLRPRIIDVAPSSQVVFVPQRLQNQVSAAAVTDVGPNSSWAVGATADDAANGVNGWNTGNGTIPANWFFAARVQMSAFNNDRREFVATVAGQPIVLSAKTIAGPNPAPPVPGQEPTVLAAASVTVAPGGASVTVHPVMSNVSVPAGAAILLHSAFDGVPTVTVDAANSTAGWTMRHTAANGTGATGQIWEFINTTGGALSVSLQFLTSVIETSNHVYHVLQAPTAGATMAFQSAMVAASNNAPPLDLDTTRRALWFASAHWDSNNTEITALPADFGNLQGSGLGTGSGNTSRVSVAAARRSGFVGNSLDPAAFVLAASRTGTSATVAAYEIPA